MNKETVKSLAIILLVITSIGSIAMFVFQRSLLHQAQIAIKQADQAATTKTTTAPPATETTAKPPSSSCPRARVLTDYVLRPNGSIDKTFYSISVDGKKINQSVTPEDIGVIDTVQVSSDCKSVAWVVKPQGEIVFAGNTTGKYILPEIVRVVSFDQNTVIKNFTLPVPGPTSISPFIANNIIVSIGLPISSEADMPTEDSSSGTFYVINVATGAITKVGGPFFAVSPDLQKNIKKVGTDVVLENKTLGKTITLAKGDNEFAYQYVFSPDSSKVAYLWFSGKRSDIFTILFRPMGIDDQLILSSKLAIQPVDGSDEFTPIRGGYTINSEWAIDRWLSADILQYSESELAARSHQVDLSTKPPAVEKQGLIDWSAI